MAQQPRIIGSVPDWTAEERPLLSGTPASVQHGKAKRLAYLLIGIFISVTAMLNNGLVTANLPLFQGEYGLTPSQAAWLPAMYVIANVSSNLLIFKARQQFGVRLFTELGLLAFIGVLILHLFVKTYEMALVVRFIAGFATAPLFSLGMYYTMQAFSKDDVVKAIYLSFGLQQLGIPLAWIISPALTVGNSWDTLYTFELGIAICTLALVVALKLPRGFRQELFEKQDFITAILLISGFACLSITLTQGPIVWWLDAPWLAYLIIAGFGFVMLGLLLEHYRVNPLIITRWLGTRQILLFMIGAFILRLILSEQTVAMVNFLKTMGMGPDQFVPLYQVIFVGTAIGAVFSALTFTLKRVVPYLLLAVLMIVFACMWDYSLTHDIRPSNFYLSQFLIGFATGSFIPILLLLALGQGLLKGPQYIITIVVLFSVTQNFGGLVGSSLFNTYQKQRTQYYVSDLNHNLPVTDPTVAQRLKTYQYGSASTDPDAQRQQDKALRNLNGVVAREAQVRAYSDVIILNAMFALFIFIWGVFGVVILMLKAKKKAKQQQATAIE
ncbi:MFS transporter [Acinetobacter sp. A47]|uniref:MFS transporter n=1 Tax=Acinetobacter sp. A47 TaxID=1561217 RepID=UPI0005709DA6|nr:MFS transporter [Acinetobacter sp. A47]